MIILANKKNRVLSHKILEYLILKSTVSRQIDKDNCHFGLKTWVAILPVTVPRNLIFWVDLSAMNKLSKITLGRSAKK